MNRFLDLPTDTENRLKQIAKRQGITVEAVISNSIVYTTESQLANDGDNKSADMQSQSHGSLYDTIMTLPDAKHSTTADGVFKQLRDEWA